VAAGCGDLDLDLVDSGLPDLDLDLDRDCIRPSSIPGGSWDSAAGVEGSSSADEWELSWLVWVGGLVSSSLSPL